MRSRRFCLDRQFRASAPRIASAAALIAAALAAAGALNRPALALRAGCSPTPAHAPWAPGTAPGPPSPVPFLSAHRGGQNLAPQQTAEAHKSAIAFGTTVTEVDLHILADGGIAAFHDDTAPDGTPMGQVTTSQFKSWNAATGKWAGTAFDPAHYLMFDEVLAIAKAAHTGMDIEFKDLDPQANSTPRGPYAAVAQAVADAGLMGTTIWQYHHGQPDLLLAVQGVDPNAHFNYNLLDYETPAQLYAQASKFDFSYGSNFVKFTPERLAAMHDGCALAIPHSYDDGAANEFDQIVLGRKLGIDGFQTNQVDVAVDALDRPAPSTWRRDRAVPTRACLVNPNNGYGLLGRTVQRANGTTAVTGPGGCVDGAQGRMVFAGDGAAQPAREH